MTDAMSELEGKFHQEMLSILPATIELKLDYRPTGLNRMLLRRSGHLVAKELIRSPQGVRNGQVPKNNFFTVDFQRIVRFSEKNYYLARRELLPDRCFVS